MRCHEYTLQMRAFDACKSGSVMGGGVLLAPYSALPGNSLKGGLCVVGRLNPGGSIKTLGPSEKELAPVSRDKAFAVHYLAG